MSQLAIKGSRRSQLIVPLAHAGRAGRSAPRRANRGQSSRRAPPRLTGVQADAAAWVLYADPRRELMLDIAVDDRGDRAGAVCVGCRRAWCDRRRWRRPPASHAAGDVADRVYRQPELPPAWVACRRSTPSAGSPLRARSRWRPARSRRSAERALPAPAGPPATTPPGTACHCCPGSLPVRVP
jgi:hypothetical protein